MTGNDVDCIDANGNIIISGGTINLNYTAQGPSEPFDYDGTAQYNGGTIIINGSQVDSIPQSSMMGGRGGMGGMYGMGGMNRRGNMNGANGFSAPDNNSSGMNDLNGITDSGVTNSIPLEYEIKKAAISHTGRAVLMVTGNKFGVTSLLTYARPTDFDRVITDTRIPSEWITKMGRLGITLNIAET